MPEEKPIGKITHYYNNIGVGVVELTDILNQDDKIHIKGKTTDFEQIAQSMQINGKDIEQAKKGEIIGLKLNERAREGDVVYKKTI